MYNPSSLKNGNGEHGAAIAVTPPNKPTDTHSDCNCPSGRIKGRHPNSATYVIDDKVICCRARYEQMLATASADGAEDVSYDFVLGDPGKDIALLQFEEAMQEPAELDLADSNIFYPGFTAQK